MPFQEIKTDAELQAVIAKGKPVVIDFSATWCGPCRMIGPYFHDLGNEAEFSNVEFVKVSSHFSTLLFHRLNFMGRSMLMNPLS